MRGRSTQARLGIRRGTPDRAGRIIPASVVQGSARISGPSGSHRERLTIGVAAGIFNSRTGTCSYACFYCDDGEYADMSPGSFGVPYTNSSQVSNAVTFKSGLQEDHTFRTGFSSENSSIAGQSGNQTTGVAIGDTLVDGFVTVPGGGFCDCAGPTGCPEIILSSASYVSYPFYVPGEPTWPTDSPGVGLISSATDMTKEITADMWLFWDPGLKGDLVAPLGYVHWSATGEATGDGSGHFTLDKQTSMAGANSFVASNSYPTWNAAVPSPQNISCGGSNTNATTSAHPAMTLHRTRRHQTLNRSDAPPPALRRSAIRSPQLRDIPPAPRSR